MLLGRLCLYLRCLAGIGLLGFWGWGEGMGGAPE